MFAPLCIAHMYWNKAQIFISSLLFAECNSYSKSAIADLRFLWPMQSFGRNFLIRTFYVHNFFNKIARFILLNWAIDTGHSFQTSLAKCVNFFRHTLSWIKNLGYIKDPGSLEGSEAGKKKWPQLHHFWGKKSEE